eukprot:m.352173 g.352173  ORF g.352173 m.352173 type:complete len:247 (-) comp16581_c2_seq8:1202-1942(-)
MADPTTTYINLVDVVPDWEQRLDENLESDWDNILGLLSLNQVCDAPEKTLQWALAQQWKKKREQFGKDIADLQKNVAGQNDMEVDEVVNLPDEVDGLSLSDKDAEKVAEAEVDKVMTALDGSKELKKKDEKQVRKELKKKAVDALRKGNSLPAEAVVDSQTHGSPTRGEVDGGKTVYCPENEPRRRNVARIMKELRNGRELCENPRRALMLLQTPTCVTLSHPLDMNAACWRLEADQAPLENHATA